MYLAPEVILNRGHDAGADHWGTGVIIYELLTGETPFYKNGMEQMDLFRAIVKCRLNLPEEMPESAKQIIQDLIRRDPSKRLGKLSGGEDDILDHKFFSDHDIDFDSLRLKDCKPPTIPKIKNSRDSSNFEDWSYLEDKTDTKFPALDPKDQVIFKDF